MCGASVSPCGNFIVEEDYHMQNIPWKLQELWYIPIRYFSSIDHPSRDITDTIRLSPRYLLVDEMVTPLLYFLTIDRCWAKETEQRPNFVQIVERLEQLVRRESHATRVSSDYYHTGLLI